MGNSLRIVRILSYGHNNTCYKCKEQNVLTFKCLCSSISRIRYICYLCEKCLSELVDKQFLIDELKTSLSPAERSAGKYIVIYDIPRDVLRKLNYRSLNSILSKVGARRLQFSVYLVDSIEKARELVKFIGPEYCQVFKVRRPDYEIA